MEHGKNTVCVLYNIKNNEKRTKFKIAPIVNFRDFHTTTPNAEFNLKQEIKDTKVKLIINNQMPVYMKLSEGKYVEHINDTFRNMYYLEEEKRGQAAEENLSVPGVFEVKLRANEEKFITFICSLEENIDELDGKELINKEIIRITSNLYDSYLLEPKKEYSDKYKTLMRDYIIASDNFVVYRPAFALYTIIAGYPWFLDWGRDALISFEGITLIPRRFQVAKEVMLTFVRDIRYGLVPNGYSEYDGRPLYNSADASLLLFEQVRKYLEYTHDYEFLKNQLYDTLKRIIEEYINGIDLDGNNIHLDNEDGLLSSGTPQIQNTWMDAKIGNIVVTPRNGKAIEINALWYNALKIMESFANLYKEKELSKKYAELAKKCKESFIKKFYNKKRKCFDDLVGDNSIRPNQLFAIGLHYPVVEPNSVEAKTAFETVTKKLLTPYGLKTLAKGEKEFFKEISGIKEKSINVLPGSMVFRLYDTYGFPPEVTKELAKENGFGIDIKEFNRLFEIHQQKSRAGSEQKFKGGLAEQNKETIAYHTATHLLNAALKKVLGSDTHQKGSNITTERMRFDFNCDHKLTDEEKAKIEEVVNDWIKAGLDVKCEEMKKEDAVKSGAECMFIEKYPDIVTVYTIGDVSKELCGGPHVKNTSELGKFKIKKEEASSSGIKE